MESFLNLRAIFAPILILAFAQVSALAAPVTCEVRGRDPDPNCKACVRVDCGGNYVGRVKLDLVPQTVTIHVRGTTESRQKTALSVTGTTGSKIARFLDIQDFEEFKKVVPHAESTRIASAKIDMIDDFDVSFTTDRQPVDFLYQDKMATQSWTNGVQGQAKNGWRCDWADMRAPVTVTTPTSAGASFCTGVVSCWKGPTSRNNLKARLDTRIACQGRSGGVCPQANNCIDIGGSSDFASAR